MYYDIINIGGFDYDQQFQRSYWEHLKHRLSKSKDWAWDWEPGNLHRKGRQMGGRGGEYRALCFVTTERQKV